MSKAIVGAKITPMRRGTTVSPFMSYKGDTPKTGDKLSFKMDDGFTYSGVVNEAETIDGLAVVGFKGPLVPSK